jgi:uncharacterized protein
MKQEATSAPWWKHGYVWLVIAGPAAVVVAGVVTLWIAVATPDTVLATDGSRRAEMRKNTTERALMPALQGRNHAATPPAQQVDRAGGSPAPEAY